MGVSRGMITVQGKDHPHTRGLAAPGLRYLAGDPQAMARTVLAGEPFDAAELALSAAIILADRGTPGIKAIPVFPARDDVHGYVFVRRDSPLQRFEELAGRRIALRDFSSTPSCWFRGMLTEIGVDWRGIAWEAGAKARFAPPPGAMVTNSEADAEQRLRDGEVDAYFSAQVKDAARLRPLLADPHAAATAWRQQTRILPIIHTVMVSDAAGPDAPRAVFAAHAAARRRSGVADIPPYGLTPGNRAAVERLIADLLEQGLIRRTVTLDTLFHAGFETWRDEG